MRLEGHDAETTTKILAAIDSINPMNGIVTQFVDYSVARILVAANFVWQDEDCDLYEDFALQDWRRAGGDALQLIKTLGLDAQIVL